MLTTQEKQRYLDLGCIDYSQDELDRIESKRNKSGLGYPQSNYTQYVQFNADGDYSDVRSALEREVVTSHAYAGTRAKGKSKPQYYPYWMCAHINTGAGRTSKVASHDNEYLATQVQLRRDKEAERLFIAIEDDGRVDVDRLSLMSLEQLRKVAGMLGL